MIAEKFQFSDNNNWSRVETNGALPRATYGHASVLDERNHVIYVHGGFNYEEYSKLYSYEVARRVW